MQGNAGHPVRHLPNGATETDKTACKANGRKVRTAYLRIAPKTLVFGTCPPCPFFRYHNPRSKRSRLLKVNVGLPATLSVDQRTVGVVQQPSPADLL